MAFTSEEHTAIAYLSLFFGLLGLFSALLNLLLIRCIRRWSGYLLLLTSMTVFQVMYALCFVVRIVDADVACYLNMFLGIAGGLGVSIWTNVLAFSVAYTMVRCRALDIFKHYFAFSLIGTVFPLLLSIYTVSYPGAVSVDDDGRNDCRYHSSAIQGRVPYDIYYWSRFLSVLFTFFFSFVTLAKIRSMRIGRTWINSKDRTPLDAESSAILSTVMNMNYYAIAQAVCRSGAAWNEWDHAKYSCFESLVMATVCSPSSATLNLLIFLNIQPQALSILKALIWCQPLPDEPKVNAFTKNIDIRTESADIGDLPLMELERPSVDLYAGEDRNKISFDNPLHFNHDEDLDYYGGDG